MLKVTQSAWERLSQLQSTRPDVTVMRLTREGGHVKCHRGNQKKRDRVIEQPGRPKLLMTSSLAKGLTDYTLDAPDTKNGPRLRLKQVNN